MGKATSIDLETPGQQKRSGAGPDARNRIVCEARRWIGTPYRHQASLKGVGCDCLGLVRGVWRAGYGAEPEAAPAYTADWAEATGEERLLPEAVLAEIPEPLAWPEHVAAYDALFVEAASA